jgi:hypothetical protein
MIVCIKHKIISLFPNSIAVPDLTLLPGYIFTSWLYLLKGNFAIFYMLAKYVPGDIKYIFRKFYRHISTNNEANL